MTELVQCCNELSGTSDIVATVAICTCNREDCLETAVRSASSQVTSFGYEVLVVDNNSSDGTRDLVSSLQREFPQLRYVFEGTPGLSHARNTALREARGRVVAYIDDDGVAQPGWLEGLVEQFVDESVMVVGGRTTLEYPCARPEWLTESMEYLLSKFDAGKAVCDVPDVIGCNFAVNRKRALELEGFNPLYGFNGDALLPGEDTEMCMRVRQAKHTVMYVPDAVVIHRVHESRLRREWFVKRVTGGAKAAVRLGICRKQPDEIARSIMWCRLNSAVRRMRGEHNQAFYWDLELAALSTTLSEILEGRKARRRALLYLKAGPAAVRWAAGMACAVVADKPLAASPWEFIRELTD